MLYAADLREQQERRRVAERKITVRELASECLCWLEEVRGAKPATIADYGFLLGEPERPSRSGHIGAAGARAPRRPASRI